jgi:hypothetical protein
MRLPFGSAQCRILFGWDLVGQIGNLRAGCEPALVGFLADAVSGNSDGEVKTSWAG